MTMLQIPLKSFLLAYTQQGSEKLRQGKTTGSGSGTVGGRLIFESAETIGTIVDGVFVYARKPKPDQLTEYHLPLVSVKGWIYDETLLEGDGDDVQEGER